MSKQEITLLDGNVWKKDQLLKKMDDDAFYYGHMGQYALSSSSLKKLLQSPKAYQKSLRISETGQALRDGRLIHMSILEKEKLSDLIIVDVADKRSADFKQAVKEYGEHNVYTSKELNNAYWVADAVEQNSEASYLLANCNYEVPEAGYFEDYDIPFRAKADAITRRKDVIIDLKTTSSDIYDWRWSAKKYNYGLQAALYMELFGVQEFIFLVVNKTTKDIGIFECSDAFIEKGREDIRRALDVYVKYFNKPNTNELILNSVIRDIL